jgi:Flp pilus assembly protein TadG
MIVTHVRATRFPFSRRRLRSSLGILALRSDGSVALEFGLIAFPLFVLIAEFLQVGVIILAQQELETATENASRLVLTGQAQQQGLSQSAFQTALCGSLPALFNCSGVMIDMQTAAAFTSANTSVPTFTFNAQGQATNAWQFNPGVQGQIIVLRVMYFWPTILGSPFNLANYLNGKRLLMASAVFQNEPCSTNTSC